MMWLSFMGPSKPGGGSERSSLQLRCHIQTIRTEL